MQPALTTYTTEGSAGARWVHEIMPNVESRVRYVDHIDGRGQDF